MIPRIPRPRTRVFSHPLTLPASQMSTPSKRGTRVQNTRSWQYRNKEFYDVSKLTVAGYARPATAPPTTQTGA